MAALLPVAAWRYWTPSLYPNRGYQHAAQCYTALVARATAAGVAVPSVPHITAPVGRQREKLVAIKEGIAEVAAHYLKPSTDAAFLAEYLAATNFNRLAWTNRAQLCAAAGAPTNWLDRTPWPVLADSEYGWKWAPAVFSQLCVTAGTAGWSTNWVREEIHPEYEIGPIERSGSSSPSYGGGWPPTCAELYDARGLIAWEDCPAFSPIDYAVPDATAMDETVDPAGGVQPTIYALPWVVAGLTASAYSHVWGDPPTYPVQSESAAAVSKFKRYIANTTVTDAMPKQPRYGDAYTSAVRTVRFLLATNGAHSATTLGPTAGPTAEPQAVAARIDSIDWLGVRSVHWDIVCTEWETCDENPSYPYQQAQKNWYAYANFDAQITERIETVEAMAAIVTWQFDL